MMYMDKLAVALYVAATSLALIILKLGSKGSAPVQIVDGKLQFGFNMFIISGVALYGLSFILYTYLISKFELGFIVPITTALVYIIIFTASYFIFKESFTVLKIIGISLIIIGIMILNTKRA